jgi:hypothetical protein
MTDSNNEPQLDDIPIEERLVMLSSELENDINDMRKLIKKVSSKKELELSLLSVLEFPFGNNMYNKTTLGKDITALGIKISTIKQMILNDSIIIEQQRKENE